ncbi:MAG TPA: phosphatidylserine decarboxylase [Alphaproteobacteria bacterium]|nr:phosphatidylserine decarboxylase [Alphaproteobacteria bacterium]
MSLIDTIKHTVFVKPHPAGHFFIIIGAITTVIAFVINGYFGLLSLIVTLFVCYFFRDPVRMVPQQDGLVVSPADGRVIAITENLQLPDDLTEEDDSPTYTRVSIFLSVFDAHVNRIPIGGEVVRSFYHPGKFLNAELDKASEENERSCNLVQLPDERYVGFTQIAGLVARRIVNDLIIETTVETGQKFGIIRFGSRMDVYLPEGVTPLVCIGQRAIAGETIIADVNFEQEPRECKAL